MPQARPLECPACGHDRIARRPQQLQVGSGTFRVSSTEWTCQLCSYTWGQPRPAPEQPAWELE